MICGPANAVFRYSAPAPSFEHATVASMKPRWLRHMIATPSPSRDAGLAQLVRERVGPPVHLLEGQRAALVDERRALRVARGGAGVGARRRRAPAAQRHQRLQRPVRAQRLEHAGVDQRPCDLQLVPGRAMREALCAFTYRLYPKASPHDASARGVALADFSRLVLALQALAAALHGRDELRQVDLERVEDLVGVVLGAEP